MNPNVILIVVLVLILGGAALYIVRAKRRGQRCIGCPDASRCSGCCNGCQHAAGCCQPKEERKGPVA